MLDYRINTFLTLCNTMNYRVTAEKLNMTQPAVTQHIHFIENEYNCKLFNYDGRKLIKTKDGEKLEIYARTMSYMENGIRNELAGTIDYTINIGATKSIGEFAIKKEIEGFLSCENNILNLYIENTSVLLDMIKGGKLDFALIEGFFDKKKYDCMLYRNEPFIGICSKNHKFAYHTPDFNELFKESLILRENGSGTRDMLLHMLFENNFSVEMFSRVHCVSNLSVICSLVASGYGISFVYKTVADSFSNIATFNVGNMPCHELNFVYLKGSNAVEKIKMFLG